MKASCDHDSLVTTGFTSHTPVTIQLRNTFSHYIINFTNMPTERYSICVVMATLPFGGSVIWLNVFCDLKLIFALKFKVLIYTNTTPLLHPLEGGGKRERERERDREKERNLPVTSDCSTTFICRSIQEYRVQEVPDSLKVTMLTYRMD